MKQKDGGGEVHEWGRIAEGEIEDNNDGSGARTKSQGVRDAGRARNWLARRKRGKGEKMAGGTQAIDDTGRFKDHPAINALMMKLAN